MNIRSPVLATFVLAAAVPLAWQQAASNAPPAKLWAAQTGPKEITLVWTRVDGGVRYRIYEAAGGDAKLVGQTMASGEQYVRPVSAYGIAHRFAIVVVFENGEVSARAPFNPVVPQEARPGAVTAPASVKAAPSGAGTISITWDGVPGATAYRIARQIVPGGFQMLCRLCPTDTTYVDHTANGGARHIYTVATTFEMPRTNRSASTTAIHMERCSRESSDVLLDAGERRLLKSVERGEWITGAGFRAAKARHVRSATATLRRLRKA